VKSVAKSVVESKERWLGLLSCLVFGLTMQAQQMPPGNAATRKLAVDIFKQLIEINTTDSVGSVTAAAERWRSIFATPDFRRATSR
jgi:hypothetical protein